MKIARDAFPLGALAAGSGVLAYGAATWPTLPGKAALAVSSLLLLIVVARWVLDLIPQTGEARP